MRGVERLRPPKRVGLPRAIASVWVGGPGYARIKEDKRLLTKLQRGSERFVAQ